MIKIPFEKVPHAKVEVSLNEDDDGNVEAQFYLNQEPFPSLRFK